MEIHDIAYNILRSFGHISYSLDDVLGPRSTIYTFEGFEFRGYFDGWVGLDSISIQYGARTVYSYESHNYSDERVSVNKKGRWQLELVNLHEKLFPIRREVRDYSFLEHLDQLELFPDPK